eukprot:evm.model.scf_77.5 EVM.evm.TU.scf_77.5   scf_77:110753-114312(-)
MGPATSAPAFKPGGRLCLAVGLLALAALWAIAAGLNTDRDESLALVTHAIESSLRQASWRATGRVSIPRAPWGSDGELAGWGDRESGENFGFGKDLGLGENRVDENAFQAVEDWELGVELELESCVRARGGEPGEFYSYTRGEAAMGLRHGGDFESWTVEVGRWGPEDEFNPWVRFSNSSGGPRRGASGDAGIGGVREDAGMGGLGGAGEGWVRWGSVGVGVERWVGAAAVALGDPEFALRLPPLGGAGGRIAVAREVGVEGIGNSTAVVIAVGTRGEREENVQGGSLQGIRHGAGKFEKERMSIDGTFRTERPGFKGERGGGGARALLGGGRTGAEAGNVLGGGREEEVMYWVQVATSRVVGIRSSVGLEVGPGLAVTGDLTWRLHDYNSRVSVPERRRGPYVQTGCALMGSTRTGLGGKDIIPKVGIRGLPHRSRLPLAAAPGGEERVAVCLAGQLRNMTDTAASIRRHLIDVLKADTFIYAPMTADWANWGMIGNVTRVVLEGNEVDPVAVLEHNPLYSDYILNYKDNFLAPADGRPGGCLYQYRSRSKCLDLVVEREVETGLKYHRVVFARPDMEYLYDVPPLRLLDPGYTWIPTGEDWGGINDRSAIIAREHAETYFRLWEVILNGTALQQLRERVGPKGSMNAEAFMWMQMQIHGVKVGRYSAVAAIVCCLRSKGCNHSHTTCADGRKYKYPSEIKTVNASMGTLEKAGGWEHAEGAILEGDGRVL